MNPVLQYASVSESKVFGFVGAFEFLAMSYPTKVAYKGANFPSALNAFHAAKCPNPSDFEKFVTLDPYRANEVANGTPVYRNWVEMRDAEMRVILTQKFKNPELARLLTKTGTKELINANHWGDIYWGVNEQGEGQNKLGVMLMEIRAKLKGETKDGKDGKFSIKSILGK